MHDRIIRAGEAEREFRRGYELWCVPRSFLAARAGGAVDTRSATTSSTSISTLGEAQSMEDLAGLLGGKEAEEG